jgi:hypothetical protein
VLREENGHKNQNEASRLGTWNYKTYINIYFYLFIYLYNVWLNGYPVLEASLYPGILCKFSWYDCMFCLIELHISLWLSIQLQYCVSDNVCIRTRGACLACTIRGTNLEIKNNNRIFIHRNQHNKIKLRHSQYLWKPTLIYNMNRTNTTTIILLYQYNPC